MESFFILVIIFGGFVLFNRVKLWLGDRAFNAWIDALQAAFTRLLVRHPRPAPRASSTASPRS